MKNHLSVLPVILNKSSERKHLKCICTELNHVHSTSIYGTPLLVDEHSLYHTNIKKLSKQKKKAIIRDR